MTTTKRYPLIANNLAAVRICVGMLRRTIDMEDVAMATETLERIGAALDVMTEGLREALATFEELEWSGSVESLLRQCENIMSHGIRAAGHAPFEGVEVPVKAHRVTVDPGSDLKIDLRP